MSNIEKIRQEIERRLQRENEIFWNAKKRGTYPSPSCEYNLLTLTSLRDFIDSLPEEKPSEDLEEAAENCVWNSIDSNDPTLVPKFIPLLLSLFISGAYWQKEQMMKEAVEGFVATHLTSEGTKVTVNSGYLPREMCIKPSDKVRIIIVKED